VEVVIGEVSSRVGRPSYMLGIVGMNPGASPGIQIVAIAKHRHATPTTRAKASPLDQSFSVITTAARMSIGMMLIAPRANRTIIRAQQQPKQ
jgi:hypothetical protein